MEPVLSLVFDIVQIVVTICCFLWLAAKIQHLELLLKIKSFSVDENRPELTDEDIDWWKNFFDTPAKPAVSTIQGVEWEKEQENKKRLNDMIKSRTLAEE